jgi:hypothetical protein
MLNKKDVEMLERLVDRSSVYDNQRMTITYASIVYVYTKRSHDDI